MEDRHAKLDLRHVQVERPQLPPPDPVSPAKPAKKRMGKQYGLPSNLQIGVGVSVPCSTDFKKRVAEARLDGETHEDTLRRLLGWPSRRAMSPLSPVKEATVHWQMYRLLPLSIRFYMGGPPPLSLPLIYYREEKKK